MDRAAFFSCIRAKLFHGTMNQGQVDGVERLLTGAERRNLSAAITAYALATSFHETDRKCQPIHEYGGADYFFRMYDKDGERPTVAAELGNTEAGDGVLFHGRGDVMNTGRRNYRAMGKIVGKDLEGHPDLALEPATSADILFEGMIRGTFTGRKVGDYFPPGGPNWPVAARYVINGTDKADLIAGYWTAFFDCLNASGWPA